MRCPNCNNEESIEIINEWVCHCKKCGKFFGDDKDPDENNIEDDVNIVDDTTESYINEDKPYTEENTYEDKEEYVK